MINLKHLEMIVQNQKIGHLDKKTIQNFPQTYKTLQNQNAPGFRELLQQENLKYLDSDLKISAHAQNRLISRNIFLSPQDKKEISEGINRLQEKGSNDALILLRDMAMIVSVNNKTVVTVIDQNGNNGDKIFTNIDSAMII